MNGKIKKMREPFPSLIEDSVEEEPRKKRVCIFYNNNILFLWDSEI